jgi:hypothetical protein
MVVRTGVLSIAARTSAVVALIVALAGCGSSRAGNTNAHAGLGADSLTPGTPASCAATVLATLRRVAMHVYHEGVSSERTGSALSEIRRSTTLGDALQRGDVPAVRAAARAMIAGGRMTNLLVIRGGQALADLGSPHAVAPLSGTITGPQGGPVGSFVTSVWADDGLVAETDGIAESVTVLRAKGHTVAGSFELPSAELPSHGTLTEKGVAYRYTSFPAKQFPSGALRVYIFRSVRSIVPRCGPTNQDTLVNTLRRVATLIYNGEAGRRALTQVHRVEHDTALLRAVSARNAPATRQAIVRLLNQHIVRLRVTAAGGELTDVGGPFVLAPVHGSLDLGGRTIGHFVLSIQDDMGYMRLAKRLVGLDVLMYMGSRLVMNSLGPAPGTVPARGPFRYRGHAFRVFTLAAKAFPTGPLRIIVLIPIPYS